MNKKIVIQRFTKGLHMVLTAALLALLALGIMPVPAVHAATLTVDSTADDNDGVWGNGHDTLREAIAHATAGDEITFSVTGTITLGGTQLTIDKNLTITGPGAGNLTISGNNTSRVFQIASGTTVQISGMTISGGEADEGGGIYNDGSLTLTSCTVSSNSTNDALANQDAKGGGGIYNGGNLTLNNSSVSSNSTGVGGSVGQGALSKEGGDGGGIYNASTLTLNNSIVSNNSTGMGGTGGSGFTPGRSGDGGGIYNSAGNVTLNNSTLSNNSTADNRNGNYQGGAGGYGGGIYHGSGNMTLTNSTVSGNSTGNGGFAPYYGNHGGNGGGIYSTGTLTLTNTTVSGNSTGNGGSGGGILNGLSLTLNNSTICNNSTGTDGTAWSGGDKGGYGGGLSAGGTVNIKNTILANNQVGTPGDGRGPDCYGTLQSYDYNLIEDTADCTINGTTTNNVTCVDPKLAALADNGGPTQTHALQSGSPAIDTGSCTDIADDPVTTDQRGQPRPMDGDNNQTYLCDIGAYEALGATPPAPPAVTTKPATAVTASSANLNGSLTSLGGYTSVNVSFVWGSSSETDPTSYPNETSPAQPMTSTGDFSAGLTGLDSDTTYYYRAKVTGSITVYGDEVEFTTLTMPPMVKTLHARKITASSAKLRGKLVDLGSASSVQVSFEWGITNAYGNETAPQIMNTAGGFHFKLNGLAPNTTIHYRVKGVGDGTAYGPDMTFITSELLPDARIFRDR